MDQDRIIVRQVGIEEIAAACEIELSVEELDYAGGPIGRIVRRVRQSGDPSRHLFFMAWCGLKPVGLCCIREQAERPDWCGQGMVSLHHLRVDRNWRSKGVAKALLAKVGRFLTRNRPAVRIVALSVNEENAAARILYERSGFRLAGIALDGRLGKEIVMVADVHQFAALTRSKNDAEE